MTPLFLAKAKAASKPPHSKKASIPEDAGAGGLGHDPGQKRMSLTFFTTRELTLYFMVETYNDQEHGYGFGNIVL